jgi:succinate dehydrogenase / fumarate reductase cytochrome b subunit
MAVTGLLLVVFVLVHMFGNLTVFQGPKSINAYGAWLQGHPLLWVFRVALLALAVLHVVVAIRLALENRRARPGRYAYRRWPDSRLSASTMLVSGLAVIGFLVYHLLHLTLGEVGPPLRHDALGRVDIYANLVVAFSDPWIAGGYIAAMLLLGLHLHHAIESLLQTLGLKHENYELVIRLATRLLAALITLGFISIPVAVQLGGLGIAAGGEG